MKFPTIERHRLKTHAGFIGSKVVIRLTVSVAAGLSLGLIEIVFAYGLQSFLIVIGALNRGNAALPSWLPSLDLKGTIGLICAVGLIRGILIGLNYYFQGSAYEEFLYAVRSRLLNWALNSDSASTSEVTTLFNARSVGAASAIYSCQGLLVQAPIILLLSGALLAISPMLTLSACLALLVLAPPMLWLDVRIKQISAVTIGDWDRANTRLVMSIKNLLLLQIYGMQQEEDRVAQESLFRYRSGAIRHYSLAAVKIAAPQIVGLLVLCLIALVAKNRSLLAPGVLASYFYIFLRLIQTFAAANQAYSALIFSVPHYELLINWWERSKRNLAPRSTESGNLLGGFAVGWRLDDITLRYSESAPPVFSKFNAHLRPGQTTVVTGASGTGKSTLLGILLGNLKPTEGAVEVLLADGRGIPLERCRTELLRRVGYVGPESFLIEGTVLENLVYGVPRIPTKDEIDAVLRLAECQFLSTLPNGLDHRLTEQGQGLSAGQKQRLSLARALLRQPTVLILDEATSNLDMETEVRLVDTLAHLKGSMTIVAVTHRTELLRIADEHLELSEVKGTSTPAPLDL